MQQRRFRSRSMTSTEGSEASKKRASIQWAADVTSQTLRLWCCLLSECDSAQGPITERISDTRGSADKRRAETLSQCIAPHPKTRPLFASGRDSARRAARPDCQFHRQPSARGAPRRFVKTYWPPVRGHDSRACSLSHLHPSHRRRFEWKRGSPRPCGLLLSCDRCRRRSVHTV